MTYQGVAVGTLAASPRNGEEAFHDRDRVVLGDLARQCGPAVHAEALTLDLLESRQRLVNAREEERRRLRRDLHDGLGPMLTTLGLNLDAARAHLAPALNDAAEPDGLADVDVCLARAKETSSRAIVDLRGMVHGLRPPALDDLGLAGAVRAHVRRLCEGADTTVDVQTSGVDHLPAAVEVAAFRIAVEAVTNTVRHARARTGHVLLESHTGFLVVAVSDDGPGRGSWSPGVGLQAMRERATEIGGVVTGGPTPLGGQVVARLPLTPAAIVSAPR